VLKLVEDIGILRPTLFCSVPRLFNRIYDKVRVGSLSRTFPPSCYVSL
jgi:long-chain acyl-CoA synthetase